MGERGMAVVGAAPRKRVRTLDAVKAGARRRGRALAAALAADWRARKYVPVGAAVLALTSLTALLYYANGPLVMRDPDTPAYLQAAHQIHLRLVTIDPARLPGYPLLLLAILAVAGSQNLAAVAVAQAGLFVLAVGVLYALLCLLLRRSLPAALVAALAGANVPLLSYVKPILSEALALLLVTLLALAAALYVRAPGPRRLWLVALCLLALFMTRPEWEYLPVPLFAYLLFVARRRPGGSIRPLAKHAIAALVVLYGVLGMYVLGNAAQNHCPAVTEVQYYNMLGKVIQYRMQDEAPSQYAGLSRALDPYVAAGNISAWQFEAKGYYPGLGAHCLRLVRDYSTAVIVGHPLEFFAKSLPIAVQTLTETTPFRPLHPDGPNGGVLAALASGADAVIVGFLLFPTLALLYAALLLWPVRRGRGEGRGHDAGTSAGSASVFVETMGALSLIALYGVAVASLGSYMFYPRLRTPFAPLLIAVVYGSLAAGLCAALSFARARLASRGSSRGT